MEYITFFVKCVPAAYGEYFGWEMLTFICGFYKDINVTSSWVSCQSVMMLSAGVGFGFSTMTRNFVGEALGQGKHKLAKKFAGWSILNNLVAGILWSILLVFLSGNIAG